MKKWQKPPAKKLGLGKKTITRLNHPDAKLIKGGDGQNFSLANTS